MAGEPDVSAMVAEARRLAHDDPAESRRWYEQAAGLGSVPAMLDLGALLWENDPSGARGWYESAAAAGDEEAMFWLGEILIDSDPTSASSWLQRAAEGGDPRAMNSVGTSLEKTDRPEARRWYERAAAHGSSTAMFNLGRLLKDDEPVAAKHWYERAAESGYSQAMVSLGNLLRTSEPAEAESWYRRAAEAGQYNAMTNLGLLLRDRDPVQARLWFERSVEDGTSESMVYLARHLQRLGDRAQALDYFHQAARLGDRDAMYALWCLLRRSHPWQARPWFRRALALGDPALCKRRGEQLYLRSKLGPGRSVDHQAAMALLERAAEGGNSAAMWDLGAIHFFAGDKSSAVSWYTKATDAGHPYARVCLATMVGEDDRSQAVDLVAGTPNAIPRMFGRYYLWVERRGDKPTIHRTRNMGAIGGAGISAILLARRLRSSRR